MLDESALLQKKLNMVSVHSNKLISGKLSKTEASSVDYC